VLAIARDLLLFVACAAAPGWAIARLAVPEADHVTVAAGGLAIGLFVIPLLHFTAAILLSTHITPGLLLADSAVVLALCGGWWMWRRRR